LDGQFSSHPIDEDELFTYCPLYDTDNENTVAERASTIIHESWHAWGNENLNSDYKDSLSKGHETGAIVQGRCDGHGECDFFRAHRKDEFGPKDLVNAGRVTDVRSGATLRRKSTFHSVYQTEYEFLCDVADNSATFMSYSVREAAALVAKKLASGRFVNTVPFFCGSTRPLWARDAGTPVLPEKPPCLDQSRKNCGGVVAQTCGAGFSSCGTDGCCVPTCTSAVLQQCQPGGTNNGCPNRCDIMSGCCVATPPPLKVAASTTQGGPAICLNGQGFLPGGRVQVSYLNVRGTTTLFALEADPVVGADGKWALKDQQLDPLSCSPAELNQTVTVRATETTGTDTVIAEGTLPGNFWCANAGPGDVGGGCR
jgi:hypothetical protein